MKKKIIVILAMLTLGGCNNQPIIETTEQVEHKQLEFEAGPNYITDLEFIKEAMNNQYDFFLVISSRTCKDCQAYDELTLNQYNSEVVGLPLIKLEWTALDDDQKEEIRNLTKLGITWTPTTFYFKEGEPLQKYEENLTIEQLKEIVTKGGE